MSMSEELKELIEKLPPDLQKEVKDFVEFLVEKNIKRRKKGRLELSWRGALRELRNKFSSVELQHKSLDWWGD
ncbi:MAG: DUF2281 domain-containing protein [Candidatus Calescibacterium sp.]|nr:DUF2281 domain-containing protein [Candidatus Calescibacterium sp.]